MRLKNFNKVLSLLIFLSLTSPIFGEEKIDIWNNKTKKPNTNQEVAPSIDKKSKIDVNKILNSNSTN